MRQQDNPGASFITADAVALRRSKMLSVRTLTKEFMGSFYLARATFNFRRAERQACTVTYRGESYSSTEPARSKFGYAIGVLSRPSRLVNCLLDVPEEFFEPATRNKSPKEN